VKTVKKQKQKKNILTGGQYENKDLVRFSNTTEDYFINKSCISIKKIINSYLLCQ